MATTVFGVFKERQDAERAIQQLKDIPGAKSGVTLERVTKESSDKLRLTEDERERFIDAVQNAATLLQVTVDDQDAAAIRKAMMLCGGATFMRSGVEIQHACQNEEAIHPGHFALFEFREHFGTEFGASGANFDDYLPAYEFGYEFGTEPGFENSWKDWNQVYHEAKSRWEALHPGTWDQFELAVQEGWATAPVRLLDATVC